MSRVLAELLGANEPSFHLQVRRLEAAAGMPSTDIRMTTQILQGTRHKIRELGLDPADTTGPELYAALQDRLRRDEIYVRSGLNIRADIDPVDMLEQVTKQLNKLDHHSDVFVVRQAAIKRILKKLKPKATMKRLGYRSMDSMFKHESVPQLLAACLVTESFDWQANRLEAYKKLQAKDFEHKRPKFVVPTTKQWPKIAESHTEKHRNHIIAVPELGHVVILPMQQDIPGLVITTFVLALHALNDMRALSAYLKLQQVRHDFGDVVSRSMIEEPMTEVELGDRKLSWRAVHWYYGHGYASYHPDVFEPHVQPEDLSWHSVGSALADLHPVLSFWEETEMLGLLDKKDAISMNVLDVALGLANGLAYADRAVHNMREILGRELFARYLHQDNLQNMLAGSLNRQLAPELDFDS